MRRQDKRLRNNAQVAALLAEQTIGRLGTSGPDGPMIKPVNFVYMDEAFYFHGALEGEKMEHIQTDPRVVFQVERVLNYIPANDKPCNATQAYECLIARGKAVIVEDPDLKLRALNALMAKHQPQGGYKPLAARDAATVAVVRIDVESMTAKVSPKPAG
ncbi:MAG: pyridoxamine 5'-phosphate oxidase family protein [Nitrospinota bacterium]|nr:pyridoxamine 5'-phosphate oxidase family protein [Nitrospinota bacterium]